jgi:hypothetical protein
MCCCLHGDASCMSTDRKVMVLPRMREFIRRWTSWLDRRRRLAEVEQLGANETASIAREIGTSVPELRSLAGKWPDASEDLLASRLRALKLDPATLSATHPAVTQDLSRLCTLCKDKPRCMHDLEQRPDSAAWQSYCPNTSTLIALQQENLSKDKQ